VEVTQQNEVDRYREVEEEEVVGEGEVEDY
jgi:hypothetical protein